MKRAARARLDATTWSWWIEPNYKSFCLLPFPNKTLETWSPAANPRISRALLWSQGSLEGDGPHCKGRNGLGMIGFERFSHATMSHWFAEYVPASDINCAVKVQSRCWLPLLMQTSAPPSSPDKWAHPGSDWSKIASGCIWHCLNLNDQDLYAQGWLRCWKSWKMWQRWAKLSCIWSLGLKRCSLHALLFLVLCEHHYDVEGMPDVCIGDLQSCTRFGREL